MLKEYVARGTYIDPPAPSLRLAADLIAWCATDAPRFNAISLRGTTCARPAGLRLRRSGFAVANAIAYVQEVVDRGSSRRFRAEALVDLRDPYELLRGDRQVPRAAAGVGARDARPFRRHRPAIVALRTHTQTAGSTLTLQQPENNIVRAAVQALAAALGGVQSMALSCFDEAIAIPTQHAQTLAVRTQQMLQHEFGITEVADPLGGSWFIEQLTSQLEAEALRLIALVDEMGGAVAAVENGFYQQTIADEAYAKELRIASGEDVVVGVNKFVEDEPERILTTSTYPPGWPRIRSSGCRRCERSATRRPSSRRSRCSNRRPLRTSI